MKIHNIEESIGNLAEFPVKESHCQEHWPLQLLLITLSSSWQGWVGFQWCETHTNVLLNIYLLAASHLAEINLE